MHAFEGGFTVLAGRSLLSRPFDWLWRGLPNMAFTNGLVAVSNLGFASSRGRWPQWDPAYPSSCAEGPRISDVSFRGGKVAGGSMISSVQDSKQFRFCTLPKAVTTYFAYDGLNACASRINAISALKSDSHALCLTHYRRYTFLPDVSSSSFHPLAFILNT